VTRGLGKPRGNATLQILAATAAIALLLGAFGPALDEAPNSAYGYTPEHAGEVARFELEARRACDHLAGDNSGWLQGADGTIVCTDKRGRRARNTITVLHRSEP
jgi:hypothetical protein